MTQEEAIEEIAQRLVEHYHPERIYLFGSAARGSEIYSKLRGIGYPADVVPWRRSDFDARGAHVIASLPATVLREGRLIYDARRIAA